MPTYTGISSEAFRHPLDAQAEQALRSVPGFDLIARKFLEFVAERPQYIYQMGNSIQVGPRQYSTIYHIFRECLRDLDVYPEPNLFVSQNPVVNASALGQEKPHIILNSALLDLLNEQEIRAVISHELGHIKCGHTTLSQMAIWAIQAIFFIGNMTFGLSTLVSTGLIAAFFEWQRKAELSADRAALLVTDNLNTVISLQMKMAGGSHRFANEVSMDEFIKQADEYQELNQDALNQVYKLLFYYSGQYGLFSHPFGVERVYHLREWANSSEYAEIRHGNYQRSPAEGAVNVESDPETNADDMDDLRRQLEELQAEIDRLRGESQE